MGQIAVQSLTTAGLTATFTACSSADEFINNGHTFIWLKNGAGATNAAVAASQVSPVPKGLVAINCSIEVTANGERMSGYFDQGAYNDSSGCVKLSYTTHTSLTIAAISVT